MRCTGHLRNVNPGLPEFCAGRDGLFAALIKCGPSMTKIFGEVFRLAMHFGHADRICIKHEH